MEELDIDPEVLDITAEIVEGYCDRQKSIMEEYLSKTSALSSEWTDDKTFGTLLQEVNVLKSSVIAIMNEIRSQYPAYFRSKAEQIRNRPGFN